MFIDRKKLATQALKKALQLRISAKRQLWEAICIYDFIDEHKVDVWFQKLPSVEGIYSTEPKPTIIIGSERPTGRQAYNAAHEFGHHVFGHGLKIDEFIENKKDKSFDPDEFLADVFAGFLLMPKVAILNAFRLRGWEPSNPTPIQIYTIASFFGVGYSTLVTHMRYSVGLLSASASNKLLKVQLKNIRSEILGDVDNSNLIITDENWKGRPIDAQVGDLIFAPPGTICEGPCIKFKTNIKDGEIFEGSMPGSTGSRLINDRLSWSTFVRVSRKEYVGRSKFRHLEEVTD